MVRSNFPGALAALAFSLALPVHADGSPDTASAELGAVTVTATRTPLIADQEVAPVIVIGPEQLELAKGEDVGAVLRQYAGFQLAQNGGPGQPESLFLRGTNSNHTLVMIDGVRINPDNGFGSALQNVRLEDVERIEIVKGPRAALYGSDAIGGVINIITRKASQGLGYGAHVGAGRYGSYNSGGNVSYGAGDNAFGLSADDSHTDGFPSVAGTPFDSGNKDRSWKAYGRTKLAGTELSLDHWQSKGYTQYTGFDPNDFTPPFALIPFDEDFQDAVTDLGASGHPRDGWRSALNLSHTLDEIDQRQDDPFNGPPFSPAGPDYVHSQRNTVDWQNDLALSDLQLLTLGLYTEAEHTATESFGTVYDEAHRVNALYAEDDLDLDAQRLVLAGRETHDQEFGDHFTWNADYGYDLSRETKLTAGIGTGFRSPTASERFGFAGNPDLKPETSRNLEAGLRQKFGAGQEFDVNLFQDSLDDLILFVPTGTFTGSLENVGHARIRGIELTYDLGGNSWAWRSDVIVQDPRDSDTDTTLLRRAKRMLTSNLSWHDERTSAGLNLLLTGRRPDGDFATGAPVTDAGYALLGASLHQDLGAGFGLLLRIDNLLDTHYQQFSGYNTAGRSLFLQLEYSNR
ncbi:MAG TPA: TonB-dependent receptor [Gammaproteobacteria bacterium]|nr:TonB-dependent receptor [Gammaproteobacteria bacterium]